MVEKVKLVDVSKCTGCRGCQVACKQWNQLPAGVTSNTGTYQNPPDLQPNTWSLVRFQEIADKDERVKWLFRNDSCMHCTDAAHGEFVVGGLLVAAGAALLLLKTGTASIGAAAIALLLCAAAFFVPAYTRYCANPDMACHYGMVPSIRFIAVAVGVVEVAALTGLVRESKRRDA